MKPAIKTIITVLFTLSFLEGSAQTEESYKQEEQQRIKEIAAAFDIFINARLPEADRIKAVEKFAFVQDQKQIQSVRDILSDPKNTDALRAVALSKVKHYLQNDEKLFTDVISWLLNPRTSTALRIETLKAVGTIAFSPFGTSIQDQLQEVYRKLLDDPKVEFRRAAFNYLSVRGDDLAQKKLVDGLQSAKPPLPLNESIMMLGYDIHGDHYPAVFNVLRETRDKSAKIEAIRVLGNYEPARRTIIDLLLSPREDKEIRMASLKTLNAFDAGNFSNHAKVLFELKGTPDDLLIYSINAEKYRRLLPSANKTKIDDGFNQSVKSLSSQNNSQQVNTAARTYLKALGIE
jgi:putative ubiquitin-RnfH superfamily antitoxin RatB of RatAB toxin-antitoxin module